MLILIYLAIGLALAYGFETREGPLLTHEPLVTLVVVLSWPLVLNAIFFSNVNHGIVKKWRGRKIWNPVK